MADPEKVLGGGGGEGGWTPHQKQGLIFWQPFWIATQNSVYITCMWDPPPSYFIVLASLEVKVIKFYRMAWVLPSDYCTRLLDEYKVKMTGRIVQITGKCKGSYAEIGKKNRQFFKDTKIKLTAIRKIVQNSSSFIYFHYCFGHSPRPYTHIHIVPRFYFEYFFNPFINTGA